MPDPKIAAREPAVLTLESGTYHYCTCGQSTNQPFCDGSHQGSSFVPEELVILETKKVALCQCKRSGSSPFCDGAHGRLGEPIAVK